jgi:hypothetical protein
VASEILQRIISKIGIGSFATFAVKGGVEKVAEELGTAAKKTMDDAANGLKRLFDAQ